VSQHDLPAPDVSAERPVSDDWVWVGTHRPAIPRALVEHMTAQWAHHGVDSPGHPMSELCAARRARLLERLERPYVIATGNPKVRSNDTDYPFRPGSDFFYLTGSAEPDGVLVVAPGTGGVHARLYVAPRRDQRTHEFFTDARYGELWVGARRGVEEAALHYGIETAPLECLEQDLAALDAPLVLRGHDARVDAAVAPDARDAELSAVLSELRLVKDDFEVAQLQLAVDHTVRAFEDVVRALPAARDRGERVVEGVFGLRARLEGRDVGYATIAASGPHSTTLHWTENDGAVRDGDLLLLDAGVEGHALYTADVTRTMPVSGEFTAAQRRVYDLVYAAQEAAHAEVRPGAAFHDPHHAAMAVLAEGLIDLGIVEGPLEEVLRRDRQLYRRYTLHGTSHMLGLDVHDCASARDELYHGELREGYALTIEPGLYFQPHDLTVPEEYRGIGVRIEDDVVVTSDGSRNLSAALPREAAAVEAWMADIWSRRGATDLQL
jgi:Xaa-Pro aminopeptidase